MQWTYTKDKEYPDTEGWYAVLLPGDSESEDGHTFYNFPDYIMFAHFYPPVQEAPGQETEEPCPYWDCFIETEGMVAWCGPYEVPQNPATKGHR